jgi:hypothetical protein
MQTEDLSKIISKETTAQDHDLSSPARNNEQLPLLAPICAEVPNRVALQQSQTSSPTRCGTALERENSGFSV